MKISGYEVEFPHQPYGVQLSFMSRVLQTIEHRQNALLEAPTGSGKTLSLLCSALSWQRRLKNEGYSEAWEGRKRDENGALGHEATRTPGSLKVEGCDATGQSDSSTIPSPDGDSPEAQFPKRSNLPRIYYATRTHSQIGQVVRELKRAGYKPKMAILASRSHYCIHKTVSKKPNLDEECEALLEDKSCKYFSNAQKLFGLQTSSDLQVHDIEDLVKVGHSMQACPYFAARHYKETAELIFCPYNYILDPVIRRAVQIDLQDAVIILDEAHNIEDICRDAASCELELGTLEEVQKGFEQACFSAGGQEIYGPLVDAVARTAAWLRARAERSDMRQQNESGKRFEGVSGALELRTELDDAGLCPERVELLWELYEKARAAQEEQREAPAAALVEAGDLTEHHVSAASQGKGPKVGGFPLGVLSRLLTVLRLLYASDGCDYRLAVQRWWRSRAPAQAKGRRRGRRHTDEDDESSGWVVQMCLWSLNPAVAFRSVSEAVRSVILASGTLSPLGSFATELAAEFQVRFEAPHVINARTQVWAGSIAAGCDAQSLVATFEQSRKPAFQDSLGRSIVALAGVVPDGLLVFFSSYSMMDRLKERWEAIGVWAQLQRAKTLVCEPHGTGEAFDSAMKTYYDAIAAGRGAIFFAICRGKVSEGLDFTDANARAVIVVGIPFPNTKDTKVDLKKQYNDEQRRRGAAQLLSGAEWYNQQAFRALNQAIGRCIRHKHDYGGIILLDRRFGDVRNRKDLSCWVRTAINTHTDFGRALEDLTAFFARLQANPPSGKPEQRAKSGAQLSSAAGARTGSGRQQSSGQGAGRQPGKNTAADTAGSKAVASSQFVTHSQPTLSAVWKKPAADLKRSQRPPPARTGANTIAPAEPAPACVVQSAQEGFVLPFSPAVSPPKPGEIPRTQTKGRGADAIAEAAWASSLATSASSQQHAAPPASDQQTASLASLERSTLLASHSQMASPMQLGPDVLAESQARQQGPPRAIHDTKRQVDVLAQRATEGGLSRLSSMGDDCGRVSLLGRQTAHLDQAACSERSANRLSCPHNAAAQALQAHAPAHRAVQSWQQLHSQHAASAAPASAAQHLMSRPQLQERRGHIHPEQQRLSADHEQGRPGPFSDGVGPEAGRVLQHSSARHVPQQPDPCTATLCTSSASGMAARMPGALSGSQPRPMGTEGSLGRPAQMAAHPSSMASTMPRQASAPVMVRHGQQHGSSGPAAVYIPRSADGVGSAAIASAVRAQRGPSQQAVHMHAGSSMPAVACGRLGPVPPQPGCGQRSSMATPQHLLRPHAQQQHHSDLLQPHAAQLHTDQQSSRAAVIASVHRPVLQPCGKAGDLQHNFSVQNVHALAKNQCSTMSLSNAHQPGPATPTLAHPGNASEASALARHTHGVHAAGAGSHAGGLDPMVSNRAANPAGALHPAQADPHAGISGLLRLPDASGVGSKPAFMGKLALSVMQSWVRKDLKAASSHLEATRKEGDSEPPHMDDAAAGVLDAFAYAREALEQGEQLPDILGSWACPPAGLQVVAVAYFAEDFHLFPGGCTGHKELEQATGLSHARLEQLLMAVAKLGLEAALLEMHDAYEHALNMATHDAGSAVRARQRASCSAAPAVPDLQAAVQVVKGPLQVHHDPPPSMAYVQQGCQPAGSVSVSAHLLASQTDAPLPKNLTQDATVAAHLRPCEARILDVGPQGESPHRTHGNYSNVSVVYDSGSASSRSPSESFSGGERSLQKASAGSVRSSTAQQQLHAAARTGKNGKSRLGEETGPSGKAVTSGQKRQALSELRTQKVKHSQREQQAWTQGTDDSDDFV